MIVRAELDLPWFFNAGATTAVGDAGLRSSMGGQVDALGASAPSKEAAAELRAQGWIAKLWMRRPGSAHDVDADRAEEDAIKRSDAGYRHERISTRLATLTPEHQGTLRLHYGQRSPCSGLSASVWLLEAARAFAGSADALRVAIRASKGLLLQLELETLRQVGDARRAYEEATIPERRKVWATCGPGCGHGCDCMRHLQGGQAWPWRDSLGATRQRER